MKKIFATLAILTGTIAANAQQTSFTLFQKPATTNHVSKNFVCACHTNQMIFLVKSKNDADWFEKMTKLTVDTNKNRSLHSPDTDYKSSPYTVYNNISIDQLLNTTAAANPDHMPIAKPNNTDKRMAIVQTDKTAYNMPIAGQSKPNGSPRIYLNNKTKNGADSVVRR